MKNPYIVGKHVYLRHPSEEDALGKWHEWFSDEETTKYLSDRYWPNCLENQLEFYRSLLKDKNRLVLSIICKSDDLHIGVLSMNINWVHHYAHVSTVFGEKKYRKMPYTLEAHQLQLKVAFFRLNLENVLSSQVASNKGALALQRAFKFKQVGVYENLLCIDGKKEDLMVGVLSRNEYLKINKLL
jgi:RimJ/RimL family protein N-acetyltransferase